MILRRGLHFLETFRGGFRLYRHTMARLVILTKGKPGRAFELGKERVTIGRAADNGFQITDPAVSTYHCEVILSGKDLVVKDLGSTNGTFIGGERLTSAILRPKQGLRLGDVELRFETRATVPMRARIARLKKRGMTIVSRGTALITQIAGRFTIQKMRKKPRFATAVAASIIIVIAGVALANHYLGPFGQVGRWKFKETSGNVAKDSSGGHDGKVVNSPKWSRSMRSGALHFEGSRAQGVLLGNILQGSYTGITIACWVKHTRSTWQTIVERGVWNQPDGIGLCMDNNGFNVSFGHNAPGEYVRSKADVQDGQWHHVAGTMSKSGGQYIYRIYVDGKLDNSITNSTGLPATTKAWAIGARSSGSWPFKGYIGDVRIFDRALSASEIRKIYRQ
jgi:hypothetical protein